MHTCQYCEQHIVAPADHTPGCILDGSLNVYRLKQDAITVAAITARLNDERPGGKNDPQLYIPDRAWEPAPSAGCAAHSRMITTVYINRCPYHAVAIETHIQKSDECQWPVDPAYNEEWLAMYKAAGADGGWEMIKINDRDYIIHITPYCL